MSELFEMRKLRILAHFNARFFILMRNFRHIQTDNIKRLIQFLNFKNRPSNKEMNATCLN